MCSIVWRPAWSCVLVDDNGMVDNVSGSIFCAMAWSFWHCFSTQCSSWLTLLLRFYSAVKSFWGVLFWSSQITQFPVEWLSWGCECYPHSLMRNYVHDSLMNPSVLLCFSVPFSLCSSLLSPSPFLLLSLLHLSSDCHAHRVEITSSCVPHSLPNTQASFSRLTKRELRLILA